MSVAVSRPGELGGVAVQVAAHHAAAARCPHDHHQEGGGGALASGLLCYGLYCLLEVRYRDLTPGR